MLVRNRDILTLLLAALFCPLTVKTAHAVLVVKVDEPKRTGQKTVIKLTMKNTFKEKIESARAQLFLADEQNKAGAPEARWVIGGTKDRPALAPGATTTYHFVVTSDKEIKVNSVIFTKLILEGGKEVDPRTAVEFEK
jgi:hypothetical protein